MMNHRPNNSKVCEPDDDYEHADDNFEYIVENILMPTTTINNGTISKSFENLSNLYNTFYDSYCHCTETASNSCNDSRICVHGGCYSLVVVDSDESNRKGELVLNVKRNVKDLLYECNSQCSCSVKLCTNRLVQLGPRKNLKIVKATKLPNQFALSTDDDIPTGGFICEYAGELLTESEALRRNVRNRDQQLKNYLICLNEYSISGPNCSDTATTSSESIQTFIDAGIKSNIGRYLNHSCDPNCEILSVRIDGPIPKLGIFARKDIAIGEELCFDYGNGKNVFSEKQQCLCGTVKCRKYF